MFEDLFINGTILVTFITLWGQIFKDRDVIPSSSLIFKILFGLANGILGCILMYYSVNVTSDVIMDFRYIAIVIASTYGGFISAILSGSIIGLYRLIYFGISLSSVIAFSAAAAMGIFCSLISLKVSSVHKKWWYSILFSLFTIIAAFALLIYDSQLLLKIIIFYSLGAFLVSAVIYSYISYVLASNAMYRKYKEESSKDFLTGLNNVRQFDKVFNSVADEISAEKEHISLLFIDIDHFKKINDTYGHTEGDIILRNLGKILQKSCRAFDIVSRNGGEEFSIMLMDCPPEQAVLTAERIRSAVEKHIFTLTNGEKINITISIGIASYPEMTADFNMLINDADTALYKAKHSGRNRVELADKYTSQAAFYISRK